MNSTAVSAANTFQSSQPAHGDRRPHLPSGTAAACVFAAALSVAHISLLSPSEKQELVLILLLLNSKETAIPGRNSVQLLKHNTDALTYCLLVPLVFKAIQSNSLPGECTARLLDY